MPHLVAALDADVLVPILTCDFLLTAFDVGLYEPVVSVAVIAEVERTLIEDFPHIDSARLRRRVIQMCDALEDHLVDAGSLDDVPEGVNPKDRPMIAAALGGEASIVVTNDRKLRAETGQADIDLMAMSADDFAWHLWSLMSGDVNNVIAVLVAKRTRRPVTAEELMETMRGPFPKMSRAWFAARA